MILIRFQQQNPYPEIWFNIYNRNISDIPGPDDLLFLLFLEIWMLLLLLLYHHQFQYLLWLFHFRITITDHVVVVSAYQFGIIYNILLHERFWRHRRKTLLITKRRSVLYLPCDVPFIAHFNRVPNNHSQTSSLLSKHS